MADPNVKIIITAVDKASAAIKGIAGSTKTLNNTFQQLTGMSLGAAGGIALIGTALQKGVKLVKDSVAETVNYNKTIREMTQVTGLGAEQISRIVQVGDDWGISIEAIRTSLAFMNKSGVTPSIENLAALADEYVNTADKSAFAEKAVKVLGRGYQTLIPLLALGGEGFRKAADAIDENLIATEDSIKASREYEVAVDDLSDAWTGFKHTLGNAVIPTLTILIGKVNDTVDSDKAATTAAEKVDAAYKAGNITEDKRIELRHKLLYHTDQLIDVELELADANRHDFETANDLGNSELRLIDIHNDLKEKVSEATEVIKKFDLAELNAKREADNLTQAYSDMNAAVDGQLGPTIEDFNITQGELTTRMGETQEEIDKLISDGIDPMSEEVLGLKDDYGELKDQYDTNATEHEEATKRIMFGILEQRAAIGDLTADELKYLDQISVAWGLVDTATQEYMASADESLNWLADHPGDVAGATSILNGQATSWGLAKREALLARDAVGDYVQKINSIPETKTTHIVQIYDTEGSPAPPRAKGANFVIPPGYNENYPIGVGSTGEHVIIIPKGQSGNTTNNFTQNVHTNAQSSTVMRDFNMMRAMAG